MRNQGRFTQAAENSELNSKHEAALKCGLSGSPDHDECISSPSRTLFVGRRGGYSLEALMRDSGGEKLSVDDGLVEDCVFDESIRGPLIDCENRGVRASRHVLSCPKASFSGVFRSSSWSAIKLASPSYHFPNSLFLFLFSFSLVPSSSLTLKLLILVLRCSPPLAL